MTDEIIKFSQNKTRICLINKAQIVEKFVIHIFHQNNLDFNLSNEAPSQLDDSRDFVVFFQTNFSTETKANIALVIDDFSFETLAIQDFFGSITAGGILVLPENNENLIRANEQSAHFYRSLTYAQNIGNKSLETDFGTLDISHLEDDLIKNIQGIALLCQQVGILGENFYEAVLSFN